MLKKNLLIQTQVKKKSSNDIQLNKRMGKKKIQISKIKDEKVCQLTFYKRRKGVLKKAMELALLCGVDVFVTIIDLKQTFTFFTSSGTPKEFIENNLSRLNRINIHKSYSVNDVNF